jgi:hypothetical protein
MVKMTVLPFLSSFRRGCGDPSGSCLHSAFALPLKWNYTNAYHCNLKSMARFFSLRFFGVDLELMYRILVSYFGNRILRWWQLLCHGPLLSMFSSSCHWWLASLSSSGQLHLSCRFHVLELTDDVGTMGGIRWQLVLCHLAAWIFVYLCLIKGIKSMGKVGRKRTVVEVKSWPFPDFQRGHGHDGMDCLEFSQSSGFCLFFKIFSPPPMFIKEIFGNGYH